MLQYIIPLNISQLRTLFITEAALIVLNMLLFAWMLAVAIRIQIHINLKVLILLVMSQYYISLTSRLGLICLESGLFGPPPPEQHWLPTFLSFLRCYHMTLVLSTPLWLYFERSLAMYFIRDYEKRPRRWISVVLTAASSLYALSGSASFTFNWQDWKFLVFAAGITGTVGCILFYHLKCRVERQYAELNQCHRTCSLPYSLSIRFQLQENIRSTKIIVHGIVALGTINVAGFVFFFLAHAEKADNWFGKENVQLLDVYFNLYVTVNGVIIAVGMLYHNDYIVALIRSMMLSDPKPSPKNVDDGQVYFLQLTQQWAVTAV